MPRILKYTISLFVLLGTGLTVAQAQYQSDKSYGLRIGFDLSRIPVHYVQPYRTDLEVDADVRVDSNLYVAFEGGWNKTSLDNKPVFDYSSNGIFVRAGVDYNLLRREYPMENNIFYAGIRYGVARMQRTIPSYLINDPYWGNVEGSFSKRTLLPQWVGLMLGMKVEVLQNFFLGWGLRLRILATPHVDKLVRPYMIPGYGNGLHNAVFDINYSISYKIPLWKPKPKKPKPSKEEQNTAPVKKEIQDNPE